MTIKIIRSNVVLNSKVTAENLENITIIGHGNSTVNCIGIGAINFISCNNVTIIGIRGVGQLAMNHHIQESAFTNHPTLPFKVAPLIPQQGKL